MMDDLVSVIVPVYNVEEYISECINSIIGQTYKKLEILLIDDGSTDASGRICDEYKDRDERIIVIHKKNGGLSDARNTGLVNARGELISFVDSDDYISVDLISTLYRMMRQFDADVSVCSYRRRSDESNTNICKEIVMNTEEALRSMLLQKEILGSAWGKLYKKSVFQGIMFPEGKICEDIGTVYKVLMNCNRTVSSNKRLYYYRNRDGSIQNEKFSYKKLDEIELVLQQKADIISRYPVLRVEATDRVLSSCFHVLFMMDDTYKEYQREIKDIIKRDRWKIILSSKTNKKTRLGCICSLFGFKIEKKLYERLEINGSIVKDGKIEKKSYI